jgi:hypothetical protein
MKERLAESEILVNKQVECTMELREQSIRLDMRVTDNDEDLQEYRAIISDFKKEVRTGFDKLEYKIDNYSRANNTEIKRLRTYNDSLSYE